MVKPKLEFIFNPPESLPQHSEEHKNNIEQLYNITETINNHIGGVLFEIAPRKMEKKAFSSLTTWPKQETSPRWHQIRNLILCRNSKKCNPLVLKIYYPQTQLNEQEAKIRAKSEIVHVLRYLGHILLARALVKDTNQPNNLTLEDTKSKNLWFKLLTLLQENGITFTKENQTDEEGNQIDKDKYQTSSRNTSQMATLLVKFLLRNPNATQELFDRWVQEQKDKRQKIAENKRSALRPNDFDNLQDFINKIKSDIENNQRQDIVAYNKILIIVLALLSISHINLQQANILWDFIKSDVALFNNITSSAVQDKTSKDKHNKINILDSPLKPDTLIKNWFRQLIKIYTELMFK